MERNHIDWKKFLKLKLPMKILRFIWKVQRKAVTVRFELHKRIFWISLECVYCNIQEETTDHMFLHTDLLRAIWFGSDLKLMQVLIPRLENE